MGVIGIDVGGTSIKGARFAADGTIARRSVVPTPQHDIAGTVQALAADLLGDLVGDGVTAVGVAVPGLVEDGVVRYAANLAWRDVPLRTLLSDALGLPVTVVHDVSAAALAEAGADELLYVSLGTGIGGAFVAGGQVQRGATGQVAEIGHIPVWPDGEPCACGQLGCLEVYASAAGVARRYGVPGATSADVLARLGSEPGADAAWSDAVAALGLALATATLLLDPARIVLGGGLAQAGEALLGPVRAALAGRLTWRPAPPVLAARYGLDAGVRGAALLDERLPARTAGPDAVEVGRVR
jgi:glucokinase